MSETSLSAIVPRPDSFGTMLRAWRRRRGASQLALAVQSGVSQRHVSFLESGRARPSREMVVQLSSALDVPLRVGTDVALGPLHRRALDGAWEVAGRWLRTAYAKAKGGAGAPGGDRPE